MYVATDHQAHVFGESMDKVKQSWARIWSTGHN